MRDYIVSASRGHFKVPVAHGSHWKSTSRIRQFTLRIFRKYFGGRTPTSCWHSDGFMAQAKDKAGNEVTVEQVNWYHRFNQGATQQRRPLCPMVIPKPLKEAA